jgi:hypothetical protein
MITRQLRQTLGFIVLVPLSSALAVGQVSSGSAPAAIQQRHNQALAAKLPGGNPAVETNSFLLPLIKKHSSDVEAQNARLKSRFATQVTGLSSSGSSTSLGSTTGGSGAASPSPGQMHIMDPCPNSVELKAWQGSAPLDPGEFIVLDGCGFGLHLTGALNRCINTATQSAVRYRVDLYAVGPKGVPYK